MNEDKKELKLDVKIFLLTMFINLMIFHKKHKIYALNRLTKKETDCNFVQENEEEEEEDEEEEDDYDENEEFNSDIEKALKMNDNINNSDEFKFFSRVINEIKEKDKDIYEYINRNIDRGRNIVDNMTLLRNVTIEYKDKKLSVPIKTVRIKRKSD